MAVKVKVHTSALRRLLRAPGGPGQRLLRAKTERVAELARINAEPHGSMTTTIRVKYPNRSTGLVRNTHPAGLFLENGTRGPYDIRPVRKSLLRFTPKGGSNPVFAKRVRHPGIKAARILQRALRDAF